MGFFRVWNKSVSAKTPQLLCFFTDKLRTQLTHIDKNNKSNQYKLLQKEISSKTETANAPKKYSNKEKNHDSLADTLNSSMKIPELKKVLPIKTNITPVENEYAQIISSTSQLSSQLDLSIAVVPIPLHTTGNSMLVDSLVSIFKYISQVEM